MDYKRLNPRRQEIRLLTISPSDSPSDCIQGGIEHVSVHQLPNYTALSYCWGNKYDPRPLLLGPHKFQATISLYSALQTLRSKGILCLWVDAICINQRDVAEKNAQVQLMKSIYQRADGVIAWVGMEDELNDDAMLLKHHSLENAPYLKGQTSTCPHLALFCQREYWTRVWIIQEIALARKLTVHCGKQQLEWTQLCAAVDTAMNRSELLSPIEFSAYQNMQSLARFRRAITEENQHEVVPLLSALYRTWTAKASDPRDKIYGILGIATDASNYVPAPSYENTVEQICQELTLGSIASKRRFDIIPLLGRGCDDSSVTSDKSFSWLPRWHALDGNKLRRQFAYLTETNRPFWGAPLFRYPLCAAGTSSSAAGHDNGVLKCEGMLASTIHAISRSILEDEVPNPHRLASSSEENLSNPYGSDLETVNAFLDTILCRSTAPQGTQGTALSDREVFEGRQGRVAAILETKPRVFSREVLESRQELEEEILLRLYLFLPVEFLRIWRSSYKAGFASKTQAWIDEQQSYIFHGRTLKEWAKKVSWKLRVQQARFRAARKRCGGFEFYVKRYLVPQLAYVIESGMRLMTTSTGHIGWVHERAKSGDSLYIIKGCSVPVILRPRANGGWLIVGDAYIQGLMAGEAVKSAGDDSWTRVEIH